VQVEEEEEEEEGREGGGDGDASGEGDDYGFLGGGKRIRRMMPWEEVE
jgi:hypothetical protein